MVLVTSCVDSRTQGDLRLVVRHPVEMAQSPGDSDYVSGFVSDPRARVTVNSRLVPTHASGAFLAYVATPTEGYDIRAARGPDVVRVIRRVGSTSIVRQEPATGVAEDAVSTEDSVLALARGYVFASDRPNGLRLWYVPLSSGGKVMAQAGEQSLIRFDGRFPLWVPSSSVALFRPQYSVARPPKAAVPRGECVSTVSYPLGRPVPYRVESVGSVLEITMRPWSFDGRHHSAPVLHAGHEQAIASLSESRDGDRLKLRVVTRQPLFGYEVAWRADSLVARIRCAPSPHHPPDLRGITLVLDPGHPPGGAVGPTGLREADVTLAISDRIASLLRARGAKVVLTRTADGTTSLARRALVGRLSGAHALLSIHVDDTPSGRDPSTSRGPLTLFRTGASALLAQHVQEAMVKEMRAPDRGVRRRDLAMLRETWTPSVLVEGVSLTTPDDEAALRDGSLQQAYAIGVADGVTRYFRAMRSGSARPVQ